MATYTDINLKHLVAAWRTAGLDAAVAAELGGHLARHDNVTSAYAAYRHDRSLDDLAAQFVDGDITFPAAVAVAAGQSQRDIALKLYDCARRRAIHLAGRWLAEHAEALVVDHLAPREATLFDEAQRHAGIIDGIDQAEQAFAAGGETTAAWHALDHLADTRAALAKVYSTGVCAVSNRHPLWDHPHPELVPRCPEHLRGVPGGWHRVAKLAALVTSGAGSRVLVDPADEPEPPRGGRATPAEHSVAGRRPVVEAAAGTS